MNKYDDTITLKPWGWEYLAFQNEHCAAWVLHIARGRKTSMHCHPNKHTRLIVLSGEVVVTTRVGRGKIDDLPEDYAHNRLPLSALGWTSIEKGRFHQTECVGSAASENGAVLLEIEWPPMKDDLVRADDAYGRGQGYESGENLIPAPKDLLKLKPGVTRAMGCRFEIGAPNYETVSVHLGNEQFLNIRKDATIKVSDYIADFIADLGITHVFGVVGGGSMHLNDSFGHHPRLKFIPTHHEQAAAMAAEAYARLHGIGCCLVTTGPGGTNAITGLACAWVDSIPVIFISGQVTRNTLTTSVRQLGVQETNILPIVAPLTKYCEIVMEPEDVKRELVKAAAIAKGGRPGPVWLDIPLDVQGAMIERNTEQWGVAAIAVTGPKYPWVHHDDVTAVTNALRTAKRPVIIAGNGIHLAKAEEDFQVLVNHLMLPVVTSWTGADLLDHNRSPYHIGHCGIFGDRASNFAVQNADFILVLGSRLSLPQIGHNFQHFAREAKIAMVDIDEREIKKPTLKVDIPIVADVGEFMRALTNTMRNTIGEEAHADWLDQCNLWRERYQVLNDNPAEPGYVNSYHFVDELCRHLPDDAVVCTDMGSSFTCTFQQAKMKRGQRWITASGHAPMGYGLPGAIGAHYATGRPVVAIVGDGGLMFNLQELATIAHHKLPITIFVLDNQGYLAMKHTFANHFGREAGASPESGVWCPNAWAMANVMGIERSAAILDVNSVRLALDGPAPSLWQVVMPPMQKLLPRSTSLKRPDGTIVSKPIEDLFPFLPRDEFKANMIVSTVEVLK